MAILRSTIRECTFIIVSKGILTSIEGNLVRCNVQWRLFHLDSFLCPKKLVWQDTLEQKMGSGIDSKNLQFLDSVMFDCFFKQCNICPRHCERNSCHNLKTFLLSSGFPARLWLTFEGQKQKFAVCSRSNFFSNFEHFSSSFNPGFYFHFKNINILKIGQKLTF